MSNRRAPVMGLAAGAVVMGGALLAAALGSSFETVLPCEPRSVEQAVPRTESHGSIKLASVTLPPPPAKPKRSVTQADGARSIKPRPRAEISSSDASPRKSLPITASKSAGATRAVLKPVIADRAREVEGRPLLRMLEHGSGPSVEIAWPDHRVARAKLYELLRRCHGLETVLLRGEEILMSRPDGGTNNFNSDRHSGFLRAVLGSSPRREVEILKALRAQHGGAGATPARLLSRGFDARLLGGLGRIIGPRYRKADTVTARYALAGRRVLVSGIAVDGVEIEGRIEIGPSSRCFSS